MSSLLPVTSTAAPLSVAQEQQSLHVADERVSEVQVDPDQLVEVHAVLAVDLEVLGALALVALADLDLPLGVVLHQFEHLLQLVVDFRVVSAENVVDPVGCDGPVLVLHQHLQVLVVFRVRAEKHRQFRVHRSDDAFLLQRFDVLGVFVPNAPHFQLLSPTPAESARPASRTRLTE